MTILAYLKWTIRLGAITLASNAALAQGGATGTRNVNDCTLLPDEVQQRRCIEGFQGAPPTPDVLPPAPLTLQPLPQSSPDVGPPEAPIVTSPAISAPAPVAPANPRPVPGLPPRRAPY